MLWATTRYHGNKINIYKLPRRDLDGAIGITSWFRGKCEIQLCQDLWKKGQGAVHKVLLHEFVHVLEYMNDPCAFSTEVVNDCTMLAQTMDDGIPELFNNLKRCKASPKKRKNNRSKSG